MSAYSEYPRTIETNQPTQYEPVTWVRTEAGAFPVYATGGAKGDDGTTPLINAAKDGNTAAVRKLLEAGAAIDAADKNGWTALFWAVKSRQVKASAELITSGANINLEARNGWNALSLAVKSGNPLMISLLANAGGKG